MEVSGANELAALGIGGGKKSPEGHVGLLEGGTEVKNLVDGLNSLGLSTPEIIAVLRAVHRAGAMAGELVVE